jgi:hypothetical protein
MPGELAADAAQRGVSQAVAALPWPLSWLVDRLQGDRLAAVKRASQPNPNAPVPSRSQLALAGGQARRSAVRGGFSALAGSTEEWDGDQGARAAPTGRGGQDLTALPLPTSWAVPWGVRNPPDANTTRGYTGPVITPGSPLVRWGATTRFAFPRIVAGTLLPPGQRTPLPREMVNEFVTRNPGELRLDDPYNVPDEGWL